MLKLYLIAEWSFAAEDGGIATAEREGDKSGVERQWRFRGEGSVWSKLTLHQVALHGFSLSTLLTQQGHVLVFAEAKTCCSKLSLLSKL